jgi:hypothetical protein
MTGPEEPAAAAVEPEPDRTAQWLDAAAPIPAIVSWFTHHKISGPVLLGVFVVIKCYVLARGDLPTALGILQNAGLTTVVVGALLTSLPILAAGMLAVTSYRVTRAYRESHSLSAGTLGLRALFDPQVPLMPGLRDSVSPLLAVTFGSAVLATMFTPWTFMAGAAVLGVVMALLRDVRTPQAPGLLPATPRLIIAIIRVVIAGLTVYALTAMLYTVWLPHEEVRFSPASPHAKATAPVVGYVLSDVADGWITILVSGTHTIATYRDSTVQSLALCRKSAPGLWGAISNATTLWDEATSIRVEPLKALHPPADPPC